MTTPPIHPFDPRIDMSRGAASQPPKDREAAIEFEGMLWTQVFQAMRRTIEPSGLFGQEAQTRSTYEYLFDQAVVEAAMQGGKGLGLADRILAQASIGKNPVDLTVK